MSLKRGGTFSNVVRFLVRRVRVLKAPIGDLLLAAWGLVFRILRPEIGMLNRAHFWYQARSYDTNPSKKASGRGMLSIEGYSSTRDKEDMHALRKRPLKKLSPPIVLYLPPK